MAIKFILCKTEQPSSLENSLETIAEMFSSSTGAASKPTLDLLDAIRRCTINKL